MSHRDDSFAQSHFFALSAMSTSRRMAQYLNIIPQS
jgi:hypothetical protein